MPSMLYALQSVAYICPRPKTTILSCTNHTSSRGECLRYAILSDIHGNYDALKAVLRALESQKIDAYACLGDIVGYGPQPAECLHEIQKYASVVVAGNHDLAACDKLNICSFNVLAREAILWTRSRLAEADLQYLGNLPLQERIDLCQLVHGSLYAPELFDYVQSAYDASLSMARMDTPVCFVGHSHVPITFLEQETIGYSLETVIPVLHDQKAIVNVGSVGQPRDKDPRACYAVYDTEEQQVTICRTPYDIDSVVGKMREAGLPSSLSERLRVGR